MAGQAPRETKGHAYGVPLLRLCAAVLALASAPIYAELFRLTENWRATATPLMTPAEAVADALATKPSDPCDATKADCREAPAGHQWFSVEVGDKRLLEELVRSIRIRLADTMASDSVGDLAAVFAVSDASGTDISAGLSATPEGMYVLADEAQESVVAWIHDNLEAADAGKIVLDRLQGVDEGADAEVTIVAKEGSFAARE